MAQHYVSGWAATRRRVLARDRRRCRRCRAARRLHVHHLQGREGDAATTAQLCVTLCRSCHERLHRLERVRGEPAPDTWPALAAWLRWRPGDRASPPAPHASGGLRARNTPRC